MTARRSFTSASPPNPARRVPLSLRITTAQARMLDAAAADAHGGVPLSDGFQRRTANLLEEMGYGDRFADKDGAWFVINDHGRTEAKRIHEDRAAGGARP